MFGDLINSFNLSMNSLHIMWSQSHALGFQVVKFVGCYHGHADSFLVQAGSGVATLGLPDSPGVPASSTGPGMAEPPAYIPACQASVVISDHHRVSQHCSCIVISVSVDRK